MKISDKLENLLFEITEPLNGLRIVRYLKGKYICAKIDRKLARLEELILQGHVESKYLNIYKSIKNDINNIMESIY